MRAILPTLLVAALAVLLAACAEDAPDEADGEAATARFVAVDVDFEQAPAEIPAGDVTVELVNDGNLAHNVTFEGVGDGPVVQAGGGETASGAVSLEAGEHVAYCSVPGHRESGMEATITVDG